MSEETREVRMIPINSIFIPDERVTSQLDDEILEELRESIKQYGILEPLLVAKVDNKLVLIDGLHRMIIAKELGIEKVPCIVKEMSEDELLITNLIVNRQRGKSNPAQEAKLVKLLIDNYKYSINEVARKLSMSKTTVEKYYQIASKLSPQILELLGQGMLSVGCAYWISFVDDKDKQLEIAKAAIEFGYTVEQCKAAAQQALRPEAPPPPGGWTFDETGKPVRVPVKAFPCWKDTDPSQVAYIPVDMNYLEDIKQMFILYCKEMGLLEEEQQPQQQPQPTTTVETTTAPQPQTPQQQTVRQESKDWWPF